MGYAVTLLAYLEIPNSTLVNNPKNARILFYFLISIHFPCGSAALALPFGVVGCCSVACHMVVHFLLVRVCVCVCVLVLLLPCRVRSGRLLI